MTRRRFARAGAWLLIATMLAALSCTRMPTAPPTPVTVHGTITGPDGEPVPYIFVQFLPINAPLPDSLSESYWGRTETSGSYSVGLLTGSYEMRVLQPSVHNGWLGYANRIQVTREHTRFDYAFHGFKVTGRLLDPEGAVLPEGQVTAKIEAEYPSYAVADLNNGQFSLLLPSGRYTIKGYAAHFTSGYTEATLPSVPVVADTILDVRLPGVPVTGTVIDPDGMPIQNAIVDARSALTLTGADGTYRLYLTEGPHAILCSPQRSGLIPRQVVLAIHGPTTIDFDFHGVTWSGTVMTGANEPVAGAHVSLRVPSSGFGTFVHTDDQGAFRLVLPPNTLGELGVYLHDDAGTQVFDGFYRATADTTFAIVTGPPPVP